MRTISCRTRSAACCVPTSRDLDDEELRRYVFRIAGNLMTDRWRRAERDVVAGSLPRRAADRSRAMPDDTVSQEFAELTPRDRALLWLAYVEEHNHQEIASALGSLAGA